MNFVELASPNNTRIGMHKIESPIHFEDVLECLCQRGVTGHINLVEGRTDFFGRFVASFSVHVEDVDGPVSLRRECVANGRSHATCSSSNDRDLLVRSHSGIEVQRKYWSFWLF